MSISTEKVEGRPQEITDILSSLSRYGPENAVILQNYVTNQCSEGTYDLEANLALLKLYQFNPDISKDDAVIDILSKSLTRFAQPDFSLCLHLLPPYVLSATSEDNLSESVQKLVKVNHLLSRADFGGFWSIIEDDDYAELVAGVHKFEQHVRLSIAQAIAMAFREIRTSLLEDYVNLKNDSFDSWVKDQGWVVKGDSVDIPPNKNNETKTTVSNESVKLEQLSRLIRRAYEV